MGQSNEMEVSRRDFVRASTVATLAAVAASGVSGLYGCAPKKASKEDSAKSENGIVANEIPEEGEIIWQSCCHCGFTACPIKCHVVDGTLRWTGNDDDGDPEFGGVSFRSCLKARSIRKWINSPQRLKYPMKRVGKRGSGEFERISWDEALDIIAEKWKYTLDTYGSEAFYNCATGTRNYPIQRLMNLTGGYLGTYNSESNGQIAQTANYLFGFDPVNFDCAGGMGSNTAAIKDADCGVFFGCGSGESRMCGMGEVYEVAKAREAGIPVVFIDYRLGEASSGNPDEWFPIYPGTDGALASAIAYVIISEGKHDKEFLDKYTVGFDADTMPEGAPENSSYMDYIMGTGYDMIPKTPQWAAPICGLPSEKIEHLAHFITDHETCFITQGFGPQRHHNGEWNAAAIAALPIITGNIGKPGTCPGLNGKGMQMNFDGGMWNSVPIGDNPVTKKISISGRFNAIDHPLEMTATTDGVVGGDRLNVGIKFMALYEAGCFGNSSSDLNWAASVLEDESKCEFILGVDVIMSTSLPYCDIILPDLMYQERMNFVSTVTGGSAYGFVFGKPVQEPQFECRLSYDWCADLAERLGLRDEFTEGKTWEEWMESRYEEYSRPSAPHKNAPSFAEGLEMGFWRDPEPAEPYVALQAYVEDPKGRARTTPSGKIELYSERLATIRDTWTFYNGDRDVVRPVPSYFPEIEGVADVNESYPLLFATWKAKNQFHSRYQVIEELQQACQHCLWINPVDAEPRGIENGDTLLVFNDRGSVQITARVTARIMPGVVGMPHAHRREMVNGVDVGANANTLTSHHWSPISKNCPSTGSTLVQVKKA